MALINVEAAASFTHSGILYKRGDVLAVDDDQAAELLAMNFVTKTDRPATRAAPPANRARYDRRDMRAKP